jgi:hypothetical protein
MSNHQQFYQIPKIDDDQSTFLYNTNQRQLLNDDTQDMFSIDIDLEMMFSDDQLESLVDSYRDFNIV